MPPTYATQADMLARFGEGELRELTDRADTGEVDGALVDEALLDAEGEIDSYIAGRYTLPLATTPRILTRYACDIARHRLTPAAIQREEVRTAYDDAIRFLKDVSAGRASLGDVAPATPAPVSDGPIFTSPPSALSPSSMRGYLYPGLGMSNIGGIL